jgi:hypothetical protein
MLSNSFFSFIKLSGQVQRPLLIKGAFCGINLTRTMLWSDGMAVVHDSQWCVFRLCCEAVYIQSRHE